MHPRTSSSQREGGRNGRLAHAAFPGDEGDPRRRTESAGVGERMGRFGQGSKLELSRGKPQVKWGQALVFEVLTALRSEVKSKGGW